MSNNHESIIPQWRLLDMLAALGIKAAQSPLQRSKNEDLLAALKVQQQKKHCQIFLTTHARDLMSTLRRLSKLKC